MDPSIWTKYAPVEKQDKIPTSFLVLNTVRPNTNSVCTLNNKSSAVGHLLLCSLLIITVSTHWFCIYSPISNCDILESEKSTGQCLRLSPYPLINATPLADYNCMGISLQTYRSMEVPEASLMLKGAAFRSVDCDKRCNPCEAKIKFWTPSLFDFREERKLRIPIGSAEDDWFLYREGRQILNESHMTAKCEGYTHTSVKNGGSDIIEESMDYGGIFNGSKSVWSYPGSAYFHRSTFFNVIGEPRCYCRVDVKRICCGG